MTQDNEQPYAVRVFEAYREPAEQYQSPDVSIHALHGRVGGSIQALHRWLRPACREHLAVPSTGEPALADHAARQSALTLPGERDIFLNIKLLNTPTMNQEQEPQQPEDSDPFGAEGLTAEQKLLNVAQGVLKRTEVKIRQRMGRSDTYAGSLDQIALAARQLAEEVTAYLQQRQMSPEQSPTRGYGRDAAVERNKDQSKPSRERGRHCRGRFFPAWRLEAGGNRVGGSSLAGDKPENFVPRSDTAC